MEIRITEKNDRLVALLIGELDNIASIEVVAGTVLGYDGCYDSESVPTATFFKDSYSYTLQFRYLLILQTLYYVAHFF